jgi:predicted membrane channel-forming protein YqfA (hemolysin III family)
MRRCGTWFMSIALALAALGIFFSDPSGRPHEKLNLFRMALHGLEVQMFQTADVPPSYLVRVLALDWLLGCIAIFLVGVVLYILGRSHPET